MATGDRGSEPKLNDRHDLVLDEFDEKLEAFNVLGKSDTEATDSPPSPSAQAEGTALATKRT